MKCIVVKKDIVFYMQMWKRLEEKDLKADGYENEEIFK